MSKTLTLRIPDDLNKELEKLSIETDRDKTYLVKKAIEKYLCEYGLYQVALDRLRNKDDEIISMEEMEKKLED